ncbi:MAG: hypothetical protein ACREFX_07080, partial [Opitutaceae bacterium]
MKIEIPGLRTDRPRVGAILIVVMVTLIFAATALIAFLDQATNDLLVDSRVAVANRLRPDAYSGLEVALAVLEDFRAADQGLHSPGEGWGSHEAWGNLFNLPWVQWKPADGNTVDLSFSDESGKISLSRVLKDPTTAAAMLTLFQNWGLSQDNAEHLVDVLMSWMSSNPAGLPSVAPPPDYEDDPIPYDPPDRPLRSYGELAAIDYAKDIFYDSAGRPTDLFWRFVSDFSLFNYGAPDVNGANADVLAALGQFTPQQIQNIADFKAMKGDFVVPSPLGAQWFTSTQQLAQAAGPGGQPGEFGTSISALRIDVTVHKGSNVFRLEAIVAPQGGAKTVLTTATDGRKNSSAAQNGETTTNVQPIGKTGPTTTPNNSQASAAAGSNIQFPFTVLEIRENDEILMPPAQPVPP